ncbi:MAG: hypothetical protein IJI96_03615 [Methanobrevibacter sp.]|nr:hypothetical protein [Methanobrevibacter sp.]
MTDGGQDFDLGQVVGSDGATGNGVASVTLISTSGKVKTYRMTFTDGTYVDYQVTDGSDASVTIVTSWNSTTSNSKVPSEKLTKDSLDSKANVSSLSTVATSGSYNDLSNKPTIPSSSSDLSDGSSLVKTSSTTGLLKNDGSVDTNTYLTTSSASSTYQPKLVSGTSIKTINNESLLGSGNINIESGSNVDIVTSWEQTLSDSKVPSEKLVKNTIDTKADSSDIPTKTSDLTNDSNYISTSSTSGLIKNDGTIDTTSYSTFSGSYNDLSNKPTIPSASSTTPSADTTSGSYGSGTSYARSNHTHPKSSLYAESSHTHTKSQITDFPSLSTVATSGSYSDLSNKPSIPSSSGDLSDGSDLVKKSSTSGLIKNDGTVDTTTYLSSLPSHNHDDRYYTESEVDTALSGKQATLVSGTNIKTINSQSLLGSGNLTIQTLDDTKLFKYYYAPNDFITPNRWYTDYDHGYPNLENGNLIFTTDYEYKFVFSEYPYKVRENFSIRFKYKASASNQYTTLKINGTTIVQNTTTENDVEITTTNGNAIVTNHTTNQTSDLQGNLERIDLLVRSGTASIYDYTYSANDSFEKQVPSGKVIEETALSNIGTSKGATQSAINSSIDTALGGKQATLVSGTNIKTVNNESLLGSGNITIQGGSSVDIVTAWETTPSDSKVASEKLTKDTLDGKASSTHTHGNLTNDGKVGSTANYFVYTTTSGAITSKQKIGNITTSGAIGSTSGLPIITTTSGVLTTGSFGTGSGTFAEGNHTHSGYISTSSTTGLVKNDGSIDTNTYLTSSAITGMLTTSDVANNLTTTSSGKVLDARQGKALADLIGDAITYINQ